MPNKKIVKKGNSKISGYGLFAKELICKGELIWKPTEDAITRIHISIFETFKKRTKKLDQSLLSNWRLLLYGY